MMIDEGREQDQAVAICMSKWEKKSMRQPGPITIKSQTDTEAVVAGYGVVFGGKDLEGETFTKDTELELGYVPIKSIFYDHTLDAKANGSLGKTLSEDIDDVGVWVEAQIDRSKDYANAVLELVGQGIIGFSSGTASHLARRKNGKILRWPVVEYSLTPTPAEPRTLGVSQIKVLFDAAGLQMPEAFNEADEANAAEKSSSKTESVQESKSKERKPMDEEKPLVDTKAIADMVVAQMKAESETKAAEEVKFQARLTEEKKKWEADLPAWAGGFNLMKIAEPGSDVGGNKAFRHWLRTGDRVPYGKVYAEAAKNQIEVNDDLSEVKAALQGQTDAEGGYLVPDDFFNNVVAKRDDMSVIRRAGATVIQTSLDRVLIPTEGTSMAKFAITAEEAAVNEDEPTFGQAIAVVYKGTKLVKISEELMADQKANLDPFLTNAFARAEAEWENYYFVSVGTGTSQPQSAWYASGLGVTAAGTNAITAANINTLIYSLGASYASSPSVAMVSKRATQGAIFALTGNPFLFQATPSGNAVGTGDQFVRRIDGVPFYSDETMPAMTTGLKPVLIGDFSYYFVAERMGLMVQRLVELYAGNGQIGLLAKFRRGGVVGQAEAFKHLLLS
jgi:HK97 family phage major capsid protein